MTPYGTAAYPVGKLNESGLHGEALLAMWQYRLDQAQTSDKCVSCNDMKQAEQSLNESCADMTQQTAADGF